MCSFATRKLARSATEGRTMPSSPTFCSAAPRPKRAGRRMDAHVSHDRGRSRGHAPPRWNGARAGVRTLSTPGAEDGGVLAHSLCHGGTTCDLAPRLTTHPRSHHRPTPYRRPGWCCCWCWRPQFRKACFRVARTWGCRRCCCRSGCGWAPSYSSPERASLLPPSPHSCVSWLVSTTGCWPVPRVDLAPSEVRLRESIRAWGVACCSAKPGTWRTGITARM